ncbi:MAG: hypothetical protein WC740_16950 [Verrucomicrobiia bacterium]
MANNIYTTLPGRHGGGAGMTCLALNHLESQGYKVRYNFAPLHGQFLWCDWSDVVIHYNFEDSPDVPLKTERLRLALENLYHLTGRNRTFLQVWPNAKTDVPSIEGWIRMRNAPYPVARPLLLRAMNAKPNFNDKPLDIYTSWTFSSWSWRTRYRFPITELAARHNWGATTGGIWLRAKDDFGCTYQTWRGKPCTGRIHNIDGPPFSESVWKNYMTNYLLRAKVSWDSMGNDEAPYCHRFIECGWAGVCVIREGPVCGWYEPGRDYVVESDPEKAFRLAFELVRSNRWRRYAENLHARWKNFETTPAVADFLLRALNGKMHKAHL